MGLDGEFKKKKCIVAGVGTALLVVMVIAVAIITIKVTREPNKSAPVHDITITKAIESVCAPTDYIETCVDSLMKASPDSTEPLDLIKLGFNVTIRSIKDSIEKASTELKAEAANDNETKEALDLCEKVMTDATDDLKKCLDNFDGFSIIQLEDFVEDLRVWLSGSIAYQQTCMDGFEEIKSKLSQDMYKNFKTSKELTSNVLAMVTNISNLLGEFNFTGLNGDIGNYARKLLSREDGIPSWVGPDTRRFMAAVKGGVKADVVVAQDGSGQYKTITEALNVVPKANTKQFVIYIKQGVYNEKVNVTKKMTNVTFIGDGPTKTKITGNLNFYIGKVKTYHTATVAINGDYFMAKNIGFENTAGPEGHQAVALRVSGDYAVFHNCQIDGYQDTLYVHSHRQFFRDCTISGTVDFIFGDAKVVFQNCNIVVRKPMKNQSCMVTAQGRTDERESTGIVLQNCHITGEPAYIPVKSVNKAYLGRPWKEFSRTIIMRTIIDNVIDPAGWVHWNGSFALDTLYYAEYENSGPGSDQSQRVNWSGIKKLSPKQALRFTPARFLRGNSWIPPNRVPYMGNLQ